MLPALAIHLKPLPESFSARLQTAFALLIPRLWWTTPPDKLFHLPPLLIMSCQPQRCHNSSPPHTFQSGSGVSFTLNPALWLDPVKSSSQSAKCTLICLCWIDAQTSPRPFLRFVFSAGTELCVPSEGLRCESPWKIWQREDMIAGVRRRCFDAERMWDTKTAATLDAPLVCPQGDTEGLTVKWDWNSKQDCVCLCCLPVKTD